MIELSDKTKNLFDAPWHATGCVYVKDSENYYICEAETYEQANRLSHLPELYDALREAAGGKCWSCAGVNVDTVLDNGCPKGHDEDCYVAKWLELLRKVMDGK